ncbi:hydrogenase maturation nickel metallochaperone HypA [Niveibacterium terrae]|uniref:hydrogenase maturation nickel metallochaperone HypA/HybF n=1 Tax=Niveibacterium terrae TaxID=3373598 RepID=UPI003A95AD83
MHEFSLAVEIAQIVEDKAAEADLASVSGLTLALGSLAIVDRDALLFALEGALRGGVADGADVAIEGIAAFARCPACGEEQPIAERFAPCLRCGAYGLKVIAGTELKLKSIEGLCRGE